MATPAWKEIVVPEEKLVDYLLSLSHPVGRSKALFFREAGFNESNVHLLIQRLKDIVAKAADSKTVFSEYGVKSIIDGELETPNKKHVTIRTVWIEEKESRLLRFVTAYPLK